MRTLAIETSGRACSIALFEGEVLIAHRHEEIGRGHAECLLPWIAELPDGGRADAILVGCGPGSFTGVRVGVAAARGLGLGWDVPVNGMASLGLVALAAAGAANVTVVMEAGHGELFVQHFVGSGLEATDEVKSLTPEAAAAQLRGAVAGNGVARLAAFVGEMDLVPAEADARLAFALPVAMRSLPPSPVYGRGPDARLPQ